MTPKPDRIAKYLQAKQLKESGMSFAAIARRLEVPTTTVQRWCAEYQTKRNPYTDEPVNDPDPGDLLPEIELMERLIRKMLDSEAPPPVVAALVATLGKLRKDWDAQQVRNGRTLHVDKALGFINEVCGLLALEFRDVCPDWAERIDRVIENFKLPMNDRPQVTNLIGR